MRINKLFWLGVLYYFFSFICFFIAIEYAFPDKGGKILAFLALGVGLILIGKEYIKNSVVEED